MILRVHKDLLDCIDDSAVVKDFVACNEVRKDNFMFIVSYCCYYFTLIFRFNSVATLPCRKA